MSGERRVLAGPTVSDVDDFLRRSGGQGLLAARRGTADELVDLVEQSGLRGRGGAGFPTGRKLRSVAQAFADAGGDEVVRRVIVNAAEGEPGTFKDRAIIRHNAYQVIEGACIAACALGAHDVIVATKRSFVHEIRLLERAIRDLSAASVTSGFEIRVVAGPGEYLYGEETAMLEVLDGRPPFPRIAPPWRRGIVDPDSAAGHSAAGDGAAVFVSNVETYANLPGIVRHGADWFRSSGTAQSPGTVVCTVTGDTVRHGVGEVPLGTTLREVIELIGGGLPGGRHVSAVLNGVSGEPLGPTDLDTRLTYEDLVAIGSGLGSASFIVVDDSRSLRDVAGEVARFLSIESCGQCEPCKRDGLAIADLLRRGTSPPADDTEIAERLDTVARGARCALAGQQERVVGRLLELARTAAPPTPTATDPFVIAPLVDIVRGRVRLDLAHADKRADWTYAGEEPDSHAWPAERLIDHPVHIGAPHVAESVSASDGVVTAPAHLATHDAFEALENIENRLEREITRLRGASPDDRPSALLDVQRALERHQRVTERLVYPLVRALDPGEGDDIVWYPQHHAQHAARLLHRLDLGTMAMSGQLVDEICAEIHTAVIELQRRILPTLDRALSADDEELLVEAGVDDLAGASIEMP